MNEFEFPYNIVIPALVLFLPVWYLAFSSIGLYKSIKRRKAQDIISSGITAIVSILLLIFLCYIYKSKLYVNIDKPCLFALGMEICFGLPLLWYSRLKNIHRAYKTDNRKLKRKYLLEFLIRLPLDIIVFIYVGPLYFIETLPKVL